MSETLSELLNRQYYRGTTVTNCVVHMHLSLLERPRDCNLCATDIRNTLSNAIRCNEWLNQWKEDATKILEAWSDA